MFPDLKNKKFIDISNNQTVTVVDQFENIAILNNDTRVNVSKLLDRNYFDECIDPNTFFDEKNLQVFTEKIKSIPNDIINNLKDDDGPAVLPYDPEEEKRNIEQKYQINNVPDALKNQMDKFKDLIEDEDDMYIQTVSQKENKSNKEVDTKYINQDSNKKQIDHKQEIDDPMINLFKNVKKNTDFKISIEILNKIPRPDFIEMMEDSYEVSIIDYLSDEFTKKIISDPSIIKDKIKEEIKRIVYKENKKIRSIPNVNTEKLEELPEGISKRKRYTKKVI
mgnify:CR=1 FL=1